MNALDPGEADRKAPRSCVIILATSIITAYKVTYLCLNPDFTNRELIVFDFLQALHRKIRYMGVLRENGMLSWRNLISRIFKNICCRYPIHHLSICFFSDFGQQNVIDGLFEGPPMTISFSQYSANGDCDWECPEIHVVRG